MQVETFECHETAAEPIEASEEAISIIESLELEGQQSLIQKTDDPNKTRCPYRVMTAEEAFVYGVLCPEKLTLSRYRASPIPLRVLQVASHAKSLGIFENFEVWDRTSSEVTDPVLVAYDGQEYLSTTRRFILARWGETLEAFATLKRQAYERQRESLLVQARSMVPKIEAMSDSELMSEGAEKQVRLW